MTETARDQIRRQIEDPDEEYVGPYRKSGGRDNAFEIEALAWAAGLVITDEGYAVPEGTNTGGGEDWDDAMTVVAGVVEGEFPECPEGVTSTLAGRTVVYADSRGDPYRFERDGVEVGCVCDPAPDGTGIVCVLHDREPDRPMRKV